MTRDETMKIMDILSIAYPGFYRNNTPEQLKKAVILWTEMFADNDFRTVAAAVKALIATKADSFPPSIGEVKEQITALRVPDMDDSRAWSLVSKACSNGIYHYREEFEKLPEDVQRAVGAAEQLREWAKMDADVVESVVASNFKKAYKAALVRKKNEDMLPTDLRKMISGVSSMLQIGGRND